MKYYLISIMLSITLLLGGCGDKTDYIQAARANMNSKNYYFATSNYLTAINDFKNKKYASYSFAEIQKEYLNAQHMLNLETLSSINKILSTYNATPSDILSIKNKSEFITEKELLKEPNKILELIISLNKISENIAKNTPQSVTTTELALIEKDFENIKPLIPDSVKKDKILLDRIGELKNQFSTLKKESFTFQKNKAEEERNNKKLLSNLRKKYDEFEKITWYYDPSTPEYTNYNSIHLYIGKKDEGNTWLRFRIQYAADTWLFIEKYIFVTDGKTTEFYPDKVERDSNSSIWEWCDMNVNTTILNLVQDIINSKTAKIRCSGSRYHDDREISAEEKKALKNMLTAYHLLGGSAITE